MKRPSLILIIDDETAALETLAGLLAKSGYQLEFASSGADGLAKARALRPDVILLDVMMPGLDGYEICRRIRRDEHLADVPVIMITALDGRSARLDGLHAGADEFISKPFDSAELELRLRTITRLNRYRRLLAERLRFQWIVDNSDQGFVILDEDGCIQYANPQAQMYLSLGSEVQHLKFLDVVHAQYRCEPEAAWACWDQPQRFDETYFLVRPESTLARAFWLQVDVLDTLEVADIGRIVRLRDVTAEMAAYLDRREFHMAVTHKLRTPLFTVSGSLELLPILVQEDDIPSAVQLAADALAGVTRLANQISDVLRFVDAPLLAEEGERVSIADLGALIQRLGAALRIPAVQLAIDAQVAALEPLITATALESICLELLENSRKFHPQHAPRVEVECRRSAPDAVIVQVSDDGVSLSPQQIMWALTPYIQSEKHYTGEVPGMGLGLPLVASLVWQAGGRVRLFNRPGGPGIVVELTLPLAPTDSSS